MRHLLVSREVDPATKKLREFYWTGERWSPHASEAQAHDTWGQADRARQHLDSDRDVLILRRPDGSPRVES